MTLSQILLEIKNMDIYSPDEWDEYLSFFENMEKILQYLENNSKDSSGTFFERIKSGQAVNTENVNANISPKITNPSHLSKTKKKSPMTLGVVSGSYDLLHLGHIRGFVFAKQFLEQYPNPKLCALVLSDKSIRAKKGRNRPILNINERLEMLHGVRCLDHIIPLEEPDCLTVLEEIMPDYFFKNQTDATQDIVMAEINSVKSNGGSIVIFPSPKNFSTTRLIETVQMR